MCLIAFALNAHPDWPLVMLANRDEFHDRPALSSHWWDADAVDGRKAQLPVFGGRDLKAGGTWMAVSVQRRLAALTNIRQPLAPAGQKSRGHLVLEALAAASPQALDLAAYACFNVLVAEPADPAKPGGPWHMHYANSAGDHQRLRDGVHGLSNAYLNTPWPKTRRLTERLSALLKGEGIPDAKPAAGLASGECARVEEQRPEAPANACSFDFIDAAFDALDNRTQWPDEHLPATGVPLEWERMLSACCIVSPAYGTRCSTVVRVDSSGCVHWHERTRDASGQIVACVDEVLFAG